MSCLHFDETRIISGALDRLIKIWNLTKGEVSVFHVINELKVVLSFAQCIRTIDWIKSEGHTGVIR